MASTEQLFIALLRANAIKDRLLSRLSTADVCAVRQASSACCNLVTKHLFTRIHVTFTYSTFTKPCRVAALGRVGHLVEHLTFYMPHSEATFLPPLVHPHTGREVCFLYTPHTSVGSALTRPKYANAELGDMLTQQFPPLFHAATNVPSFINALALVPNMRHLTVRCPGQDQRERYRRSIVDYALISLRIAVERAPMTKLIKLSLSSLHPSAFNYLRHVHGIGCVPSAARRWRQIKKLQISVEIWDFYGPSPGLDHLKTIDDYIRSFAPSLDKFTFAWIGARGPCPIALSADPLFAPPRGTKKLFHEVTSPMSPLPMRPSRSPIHFPVLRHLQIRNATMNAPQLSGLIKAHSETVKEFDFDNVVLSNSGSWDEALAPLGSGGSWSRSSLIASSERSFVSNDGSDELPSPSAAVAAANKELLEVDLGGGFGFGDKERTRQQGDAEGVAAARDGALGVTTKLKKRVRRRRRKHHWEDNGADEASGGRCLSPSPSPQRPKHKAPPGPEPPRSVPEPIITAPRLASGPLPVLLEPSVYEPGAAAPKDVGISRVQRNLERDEAHRLLAEDAATRVSALRRAKQAVLARLGREFCGHRSVAASDKVAACRLVAGGEVVEEDRSSLESRSALVPLILSRS